MTSIKRSIVRFLMAVILAVSFVPTPVKALGAEIDETAASSLNAPDGYQPNSVEIITMFRGLRMMADVPVPSILLIEDVTPWGVSDHHALLQSLGTVEKVASSSVNQLDLGRFDLIVLSNDQLSSTYANYANFKGALEQYLNFGGTVLMGVCDSGWNGGTLSYTLPGDLQKIHNNDSTNVIVDDTHPIVTGELTSSSALLNNDLYGTYCSHTSFDESTIPNNGRVILRDSYGSPTLVEYPYGAGTVIASGLTWEHNLYYTKSFSPKALKDLYTYAMHLASDTFFFEISSAIVEFDDWMDITVSAKNNPGISGVSFDFVFDNTDGHLTPVSITPANGVETFYSNMDSDTDWTQTNAITAVWASPEDHTEDFDLFTVRFYASNDIEYRAYPLTLSGMVVNGQYEELDYTVKTGSITALSFTDLDVVYGDIYMDQQVDIKDAVKLAQYMVDTVDLNRYERIAGNVHWDSPDEEGRPGSKPDTLNIKDAIKLGRHLAAHEGVILGSIG